MIRGLPAILAGTGVLGNSRDGFEVYNYRKAGYPYRAAGIKLKMRNAALTRPIHMFHAQVEALDAAMVVSRASPKKGPVHDLRTAARYVEAQLP